MSYGTELPQDLVLNILYRLPAKSLCRFKCVSKSWLTLISYPHFAKTHLNRSNSKTERAILISDDLYSVDCAEAFNNDDLIATKLDLFSIEKQYEFEILGSCNGLILVRDANCTKFLLNPSTREIRELLDSPFAPAHAMNGLGYDSSADDFRIVAIDVRSDPDPDAAVVDVEDDESCCTYTIASLYSLKTDSWRRIQDVLNYHYRSRITTVSMVLVNESLHWLIFGSYGDRFVIAAFDLADEKFHDVQRPSSLVNNNVHFTYILGVCRGCLCIFVCGYSFQIEVWVMKEYGVTESWTKHTRYIGNMYMEQPLYFLVDEEVLMRKDRDELFAFNAEEKTSREIVVRGIPAMFRGGMTYVESLVSPYHAHGIDG
ncbi:F-box/kelch-repeat protein At3g06240-like isoform X2 [Cornus florida]|nr:F-box/kelch-repeat protein At3g06240-like isoform X2 [Cornus florida]